nr:hypothetical protein [Peribacillus butanolivorans]
MDGYIAREDGSMDWLEEKKVQEIMDTVIMGNKTYQQIHTRAEEFPYQDKPATSFLEVRKVKTSMGNL